MNYWLNESPMADPFSQNAIAFALKRVLIPGAEVRLDTRETGQVDAVVNGSVAIPLPARFSAWWRGVLTGREAQPVRATVSVPTCLLNPKIRPAREAPDPLQEPKRWPAAHAA